MAGRGNPSFLKNQKARKRQEKAAAKRTARQARRDEKANRATAGSVDLADAASADLGGNPGVSEGLPDHGDEASLRKGGGDEPEK